MGIRKSIYKKPEVVELSSWLDSSVRGFTCLGGHCVGDDKPQPCVAPDENAPCFGSDPFA